MKGKAAKTRALLVCGAVAGPLIVATFLVAGYTRANYDPLRHPISSLALGPCGWTQTANFVVADLLTLAFAFGLRRVFGACEGSTWGPLLVGIWAVGLIGAGVFATDPASGYPPGTPDQSPGYTWPGALHDLFSLAGFAALVTTCFVFGRRFAARGERGWAFYSVVSGLAFAVAFVLASAGFGQAAGFGWLSLLAVHTIKRTPRTM